MKDLALIPAASHLVARGRPASANPAIDARNDVQAAAAWLSAKGGGSDRTFDAYRREVTRLLLWLDEQCLAVAEMTVDNVHEFYEHLADPPSHWIRPRKPRRDERLMPTQQLIGKLSPESIQYSRTVLGQFADYLMDAGYLQRNVFHLSKKQKVVNRVAPTKFLDLESWQWFWEWLISRPTPRPVDEARVARQRWLFALLYHTGIRREEAAHGLMGNFGRNNASWFLTVVGKGNKEAPVTVNSSLLGELRRYRRSLGLPELPVATEKYPLVMSLLSATQREAITPRAIGLLVQKIAKKAVADCADEHIQERLLKMSTHWLRHTNATHRFQAGASLESTQDELRHADPRTTRIYMKVADIKRHEDAEKLASLAASQPKNGDI